MGINVFINYYHPVSARRAVEIDECYNRWIRNAAVDKKIVLAEAGTAFPASGNRVIETGPRPSLREYFDAIGLISSENDINIVSNSDCFLAEEDTVKLADIARDTAYCLSRVEIKSVDPVRCCFWRNRSLKRKHGADSQDCWVIRGRPRPGMTLDFPLGLPGCDNRLAYELKRSGYCIVNPSSWLRLYHYHRGKGQAYAESDRVPGPYAFPEKQ